MFSPTEKQILKIMRATKKKLTITEIAEKFYNDEPKPIDPNAIMSGAVLNINKKCRYNKLSWSINSKGLGRGGKTVWIEDEK